MNLDSNPGGLQMAICNCIHGFQAGILSSDAPESDSPSDDNAEQCRKRTIIYLKPNDSL